MNYSKGRKIYIALSAIALVTVLITIFVLSSQNGEDSSSTSGFFTSLIEAVIGQPADEALIRTLAHFCEFAGLGLLMCNFIFSLKDKLKPIFSILISCAYAVTDEIHQYFVPDRACQLSDFAVDSAGIVVGVVVFCGLMLLSAKCKTKSTK